MEDAGASDGPRLCPLWLSSYQAPKCTLWAYTMPLSLQAGQLGREVFLHEWS